MSELKDRPPLLAQVRFCDVQLLRKTTTASSFHSVAKRKGYHMLKIVISSGMPETLLNGR